jgi:preprotein translocase subunit SecA
MRLFGSERVMSMMDALRVDEDEPLTNKMLTNSIERAQKNIESRHFQTRKNVLEYDDVMNTQRLLIYAQRQTVLDGENISESVLSMVRDVIDAEVVSDVEPQDTETFAEYVRPFEGLFVSRGDLGLPEDGISADSLKDELYSKAERMYQKREEEFGIIDGTDVPVMREIERTIMLRVVDEYWMEHIDAMDDLRDSVRLRGYAQVNPVDEYKREGFDMFEAMIAGIKQEVVRRLYSARIRKNVEIKRKSVSKNERAAEAAGSDPENAAPKKLPAKSQKIGRNDPCPCGKKKPDGTPVKYKNCHGA